MTYMYTFLFLLVVFVTWMLKFCFFYFDDPIPPLHHCVRAISATRTSSGKATLIRCCSRSSLSIMHS